MPQKPSDPAINPTPPVWDRSLCPGLHEVVAPPPDTGKVVGWFMVSINLNGDEIGRINRETAWKCLVGSKPTKNIPFKWDIDNIDRETNGDMMGNSYVEVAKLMCPQDGSMSCGRTCLIKDVWQLVQVQQNQRYQRHQWQKRGGRGVCPESSASCCLIVMGHHGIPLICDS